jgi:hypothetical protein
MKPIRTATATVLVVLTAVTATGCGSDSELRSPPRWYNSGALDDKTGAERDAWIRTELLIGLPWREAQQMAHDAGWDTQVIFTVEGEPTPMTADLRLDRLRLIVDGGEEAGTVTDVINS